MVSARAAAVAEVLWELKRADKVATLTAIAYRAGFNPGQNGKTILNCLDAVRRDWPHLQWWRAISDDGTVAHESEHAVMLQEWGVVLDDNAEDGKVAVLIDESRIMVWSDDESPAVREKAGAKV